MRQLNESSLVNDRSDDESSSTNDSFDRKPSSTQNFVSFIRDQVGTVGTLFSSTPLLSDYTKFIAAPDEGIALLTSIICAAIFFGFFWARYALVSLFKGVSLIFTGFTFVTLGGVLLIHYKEWSFQVIDNLTKDELTRDILARLASESHIGIIALYVAGFTFILGGVSLIFIQGYTQEEERRLILNQALAEMTPEQWHFLQDLMVSLRAITQISNDSLISQKARNALKDTAKIFYRHTLGIFGEIDRYEIIVPGPGPLMNKVCSEFFKHADQYRALSYDDLDFWLDQKESCNYLRRENSLDNAGKVERIFIFPKKTCQQILRDSVQKENFIAVIKGQCERNIRVYITISEQLPLDIPGNKLDFGIFDLEDSSKSDIYKPFAIAYWRGERGPIRRQYKITIAPKECSNCNEYYELVKGSCITISKANGERCLIKKEDEIETVLKAIEREISKI